MIGPLGMKVAEQLCNDLDLSWVLIFDPMDCNPPGSSSQEFWSGLPFPSPGDLPNPGINLGSPVLQKILY